MSRTDSKVSGTSRVAASHEVHFLDEDLEKISARRPAMATPEQVGQHCVRNHPCWVGFDSRKSNQLTVDQYSNESLNESSGPY